MIVIKILYFAIAFIVGLIGISKGIAYYGFYKVNIVAKNYSIMCFAFALWSFLSIGTMFLSSEFWIQVFFLISEFAKIVTFVSSLELLCNLVGCFEENKLILNKLSSVYLYFGVAIILFELILGNGKLNMDGFGPYFLSPYHFFEIIKSAFYIFVMFGYFYIVVSYRDKCNKQRELYAYRLLLTLLVIVFTSMVIEVCGFCVVSYYIPSMIIAYAAITILVEKIIQYMRSIELFEGDFIEELSPKNLKRVFICDDEGKIIFRNKRLDVFANGNRDSFEKRTIFDVFDISSAKFYEICENKGKETINVKTLYKKSELPMYMCFSNRLDRYDKLFACVVTIYPEEEFLDLDLGDKVETDTDSSVPEVEETSEDLRYEINSTDRRNLQIDSLIALMINASRLYKADAKKQFEYNLKGIIKTSSMLSFSALEELAGRIEDACLFNDWQAIEPMLIEMDRQLETIRAIRG